MSFWGKRESKTSVLRTVCFNPDRDGKKSAPLQRDGQIFLERKSRHEEYIKDIRLKDALKKNGYPNFREALVEITGNCRSICTDINQGRRSFNRKDMDLLLEAIGEEATDDNYLRYFPTLGLDPKYTPTGQMKTFIESLKEVIT